jgi:hypothetical protein
VCSGNTICNDRCCGGTGQTGTGTCCGPNAYCIGTSCVSTLACSDDAACVNGGFGQFSQCIGGSCCPNPYFTGDFDNEGQAIFGCCSPGSQYVPGAQRCCGYPNYTGQCIDCHCSFVSVRKWGR